MEFAWRSYGVLNKGGANLELKKGEVKRCTTAMDIPRTETGGHPYLLLNQVFIPSSFPVLSTENPSDLNQTSLYYRRAYPDLMQSPEYKGNDGVVCADQWGRYLLVQSLKSYYTPIELTNITTSQLYLKEPVILRPPETEMVEAYYQNHKHSTAYMKRNVYKSIIRAMYRYRKNNARVIDQLLSEKGYSKEEIQKAFDKINKLNNENSIWKNPRKSRTALYSMISKRTPCTYILKETLHSMLSNWRKGTVGRVSKGNLCTYKEVYQDFYNQTLKLLSTL